VQQARLKRSACALPLLLLVALPSFAQGPDARWRTVETPHFRIHYPADSEVWTRRAAARLESIWARVEGEVGYRPPERVDVLVSDPIAQSNGMALPFLGWPRLILWTSPPEPESEIGHYDDWSELLLVHESTHLVHMLRPSRNPAERLLAGLVPIGPVARKSPRWVTEGYATLVEGRLTGSGRPNGDLRAAILRRRAQEGKLPGYGQLNGDKSWHGFSMAYLMGSAYLEWLDGRSGPGSFPKLWARMSARRDRSFDEAFTGVYGNSPADLYGRFTAELTYRAVAAEKAIAPVAREGELWQDLTWTTGAPALSADGSQLAIVLHHRDKPAELVVWSTAPDEKAEKEYAKKSAEIAARDSADVQGVRTKPLARKPLHRLPTIDGIPPESPRFFRDGRAILFVRFEPDGEGFLHPDLFRWEIDRGGGARLTRGADLREPDPAPDGTWAVAVRNRNGFSQIVRVELATGTVSAITQPTIEAVYDHPRLSPDGTRVAFAYHSDRAWRLIVRDLASAAERELAPPGGGTIASPAWSADGKRVYAVVGGGGFLDVFAFPAAAAPGDATAAAPVAVTRTQGGALAPEPTPDGKALFYLNPQSDGLDLYRLELAANPPLPPGSPPGTSWAELAPAVRPAPPDPAPAAFPTAEVLPGHPYGLGRQEIALILSASGTSAGETAEVGVRVGDVVGRLDLLALGAVGGGAPAGGAIAGAYRGLPVVFSFHLFDARDRPSTQSGRLPTFGIAEGLFDLDLRGAELAATWDRRFGPASLHLRGGGLWSRQEPRFGLSIAETVGFVSGRVGGDLSRGSWHLVPAVAGHWERQLVGDRSGPGPEWQRRGAAFALGVRHDKDKLTLAARRDSSTGTFSVFDLYQLGGFPSSLLPESVEASRIASPALPARTRFGPEYEGERAELELGAFPAPLFYERHRLWFGDRGRGPWLDLAGLEWRFSTGPIPVARIPALDFRVGLARILSDPYRGSLRWWLTTVLRP
jgi:hypothetical protein